ncbi:MAG: tubulin-like doman-containing protein [Gemmataceae bacterium]
MPITPGIGVEICPGYHLVDRIGFGGYGEVWKVAAPGGLDKAVKVVYGDLTGPRAEQELKALERIKGVRHPFLLSLERVEALEGRLLIFTELADQSLLDRFRECRAAGLPGVPREELLGHLRDAAEALDHLSEKHGLQHLDIKPENLLLLSGRIKVADFGLVKEVLGAGTHITGGITPIYAAPEAFDGRASRQCDQYSLAVVYQEMLTGQRPFPGTTAFQLAAQHTCAPPLLDPLPPQDRPVLARALSKIPQQRFASCREMVEKLLAAPARAPVGLPPAEQLLGMQTALPGGASRPQADDAPWPDDTPGAATGVASDPSGMRPTLFVGLGGLAGLVLRRLKEKLARRYGDLGKLPILGTLLIDTDRASLRHAQQGPAAEALAPDEVLHCPLFPPEHYRDQADDLTCWIDRRWLFGLPRSLQTEGLRPLGRLALVDNAAYLLSALRQALGRLASPEAKLAAVGATARGLRTEAPRVFVVAAITGGTGGGMLVDVAYAARQVLAELGLPDDGLCGVLLGASGPQEDEVVRARANAYATLRELQHWARDDVRVPGTPGRPLAAAPPGVPPFADGCYRTVVLGESRPGGNEGLADRLAEYLAFDVEHGATLDRLRLLSRSEAEGPAWRGCGLSRLRFPRAALADGVNQLLCLAVVERWRGEPAPADRDRLERQTREALDRHALTEEPLLRRGHDWLPDALGRDADAAYHQLAEAVLAAGEPLTPGGAGTLKLVARIDQLLGPGPEPDGTAPIPPTALESRLRKEGEDAGRDVGLRLIAWLQDLVETPGLRLRGADLALDLITRHLLELTRSLNGQARQLQACRQTLRQRAGGRDGSRPGLLPAGMRLLWEDTPRPDYLPWCLFCVRLEEVVFEGLLQLLQKVQSGLRGWGHDLSQARRKLAEFPTRLAGPPPAAAGARYPAQGEMLPYGAGDLATAVAALLGHLPVDLPRQFDLLLQAEVLDTGGGLWGLLTGKVDGSRASLSRSLASADFWGLVGREQAAGLQAFRGELTRWGHTLVSEFLKGTDLVGLILERYGDDESLRDFIRGRAPPPRPDRRGWQHLVLVLPEGPDAGLLREHALEALVGAPLTALEAGDDLLLVQEGLHPSLAALAGELTEDDPELIDLAGKLLTRRDVGWTDFPAGRARSPAGQTRPDF